RNTHTATLLQNGTVLVVGGISGFSYVDSAEIYDRASGAFAAAGTMGFARAEHTATLLQNGKVLIAGGRGRTTAPGGYVVFAELYNPTTRSFATTSSLVKARGSHTATALPDGKVLIVGGYSPSGVLAS